MFKNNTQHPESQHEALVHAAGEEARPHPVLAAKRLDMHKLLSTPETPIPWRCDRLAADGYVTVLTGEGGEGKSFLTLALAQAVVRGGAAGGIECRLGRALMFDAENGPQLLTRRVRAAGIDPDGIAFYDADGFDLRRHQEQFKAVIKAERANLVVIDSLRILAPGAKESEADDMAPVMTVIRRFARETKAAVVVVHHRGKGEGASDYRGSSVIRDQADMLFVLGRAKADPMGASRRYLRTSKCRIDAEPEQRWMTIDADPAVGPFAIREVDAFDAPAGGGAGKRREIADQLLSHLTAGPRSRAALARAVGLDAGNSTVRRALELLESDGHAEQLALAIRRPAIHFRGFQGG
jgi:archaellum biogenesis ATPase FlaH